MGGQQAQLLWSLSSSEGSYHKEDMPLGRWIKGLTVSHWLYSLFKLYKDFKILSTYTPQENTVVLFYSLYILWSQIATMTISHIYSSKVDCNNLFVDVTHYYVISVEYLILIFSFLLETYRLLLRLITKI